MTRKIKLASLLLLSTTAAAPAQSVLERVLGTIDNSTNLSQVNGTFANIAESVRTYTRLPTVEEVALGATDADPSDVLFRIVYTPNGTSTGYVANTVTVADIGGEPFQNGQEPSTALSAACPPRRWARSTPGPSGQA